MASTLGNRRQDAIALAEVHNCPKSKGLLVARRPNHLSRLECFARVAQQGSISGAARWLGVGPSSVSRQIAALETELGVVLIHRTTRQVGLTEAGRLYLDHALRILADVERASQAVADLQGGARGVLRLTAAVGFCQYRVAGLIPEFLRRHPDLEVDLNVTDRVVDLIEENVDLAIRIGQLSDSNLVARRLDDGAFVLCASPQYLSEHDAPRDLDDLPHLECIQFSFAGWQHWRVIGPSPRDIPVGGRLRLNDVATLHAAVLAGGGLALLPRWVAGEDLQAGRLVELLPEFDFSPYVGSDTGIYAIYIERRYLAPKTRLFLDYLVEALRSKPVVEPGPDVARRIR